MERYFIYGCMCLLSTFASMVFAEEHLIGQKEMKFSQEELVIKVGDTVSFRNDEDEFHNVFSLSDTSTFDLGSYAKGDVRKVVFEKPGIVEVECAIHPTMLMTIEVKE